MDSFKYFTVTISARPLGIRFGHFTNDNDKSAARLHQVLIGSYGSKIGLLVGDTLIAVNSECVSYLPSSKALNIFRTQQLPFQATFSREIKQKKPQMNCDNSGNSCNSEDALSSFYINNNTPMTPSDLSSNSNNKSLKIPFLSVDSYLSNNSDSTKSTSLDINPLSITDSLSVTDSYSFVHKPSVSMETHFTDAKTVYKHNANDFVMIDDDQYYQYYENIDENTKLLVSGCLREFKYYFKFFNDTSDIFEVLIADYLCNNTVMFDKRVEHMSPDTDNTKVITVSSNGFKYGIHSWSVQLLACDIFQQEIGVVENVSNLENVICLKGGVTKTPQFGARSVYGNELSSGKSYYSSVNSNNNIRCKKTISQKIGWTQGSVIKTSLNLRKGNIQWFLNGEKVRKTISVQKGKIYYPIIAFSGNCKYELIEVN